jgi:predicted nuclease of restriction endonuclease-like (RecB) superfamily
MKSLKKAKGRPLARSRRVPRRAGVRPLLADVRGLILAARERVAGAVNASLVLLYWEIGRRVRRDILRERRAEYGAEVVEALTGRLSEEFGRGFGRRNLFSMIRFAEVFPDPRIVQSLIAQLGWTHFLHIIPIDDPLKREFYAELCRVERWNTRTLARKIQSMLYERSALSKKPDKLIRRELASFRAEDTVTPDLVFRDPYFLDFLGLKDTYAERDLEAGILRQMESFILELGAGFTFVERQKRISADGADFHLDLLFFHRTLRRLVAIDLKLRAFQPGDKGQMEFYLRWLDRFARQPGEETPIGLILCAGTGRETIELLDLEKSGIRVSSYWTALPPKRELERRLHEAVRLARARESGARDPLSTRPRALPAAPGRAPGMAECRGRTVATRP